MRSYLSSLALRLALAHGVWICNHFHKSWMWSGGLQKHCRKCGRSVNVKWFEVQSSSSTVLKLGGQAESARKIIL